METTISVRIDKEIRDGFGAVCREIGITPSAAISIFVHRMLADRAIPFAVSAPDPFYSPDNIRELKKRAEEMHVPAKRKTTRPEDL
ncbi:MAG: type II toxin-antitoxin system RelB/DinJ family antitoxin [Opitutales bacterium]|nr:type II toxin-antitoxin system RelB/DinJ family antitoxin [Opitutales bacterium]